ncbi:MAG: signal peptidase I [Rhodanobacteraceae bacterium]|nr:MAG: signal peptidase I [Rhodanobacteraceae bacterium]
MKKDFWSTVALVLIVAACLYAWYKTADFALALVLITAAFFVIWLVDRLTFARRRKLNAAATGEKPHDPVLVDYARSFFPVILAVLVFRTFLLEPFRIPSGSMMPTLRVGDFVLVNKFAYGLRLPVTNTKVLDTGEPKRGDIAVFRYPLNPKEDYIKRIVGLPGDTIKVVGEQLYVNGKPAPQTLVGPYRGEDKVSLRMEENPNMAPVMLYAEDLAGVKHQTLHFRYIESYNCFGSGGSLVAEGGCEWKVPRGEYFAMGDNRDDSADSRFWGFVPERNLAGKAFFIWFSLANWHRIGTVLH